MEEFILDIIHSQYENFWGMWAFISLFIFSWLFGVIAGSIKNSSKVGLSVATFMIFIGLVFVAMAVVAEPDPNRTPPISRINRTTVIEINNGDITYIVQRKASGRDTIGYSDSDFRTIAVSRDGRCYREVQMVKNLPISCIREVR